MKWFLSAILIVFLATAGQGQPDTFSGGNKLPANSEYVVDTSSYNFRNVVSVGLLRQTYSPYTNLAFCYERQVWRHFSVSANLTYGPLKRRPVGAIARGFRQNHSLEGRWYFAFRQNRHNSGVFLGVMASGELSKAYWLNNGELWLREWGIGAGPEIGYQQVLFGRFQISGGFTTQFYPRLISTVYDSQGQNPQTVNWGFSWYYLFFFRTGINF